jgi:hypothetical protein
MAGRFSDAELALIVEAARVDRDPDDTDGLARRFVENGADRDRGTLLAEAVQRLRAGRPVDLGGGEQLERLSEHGRGRGPR